MLGKWRVECRLVRAAVAPRAMVERQLIGRGKRVNEDVEGRRGGCYQLSNLKVRMGVGERWIGMRTTREQCEVEKQDLLCLVLTSCLERHMLYAIGHRPPT